MLKHICNIKNSRQGHDLPISENDREISPICEENKTLAKIFEFTVNGPVHEIWILTCKCHSLSFMCSYIVGHEAKNFMGESKNIPKS